MDHSVFPAVSFVITSNIPTFGRPEPLLHLPPSVLGSASASLADEARFIGGINLRNSEVWSVVNFVFVVIEMKTLFRIALLVQLVSGVVITAKAADVTEAEFMQVATELAR